MATFRLYDNNVIYLYHWITSRQPFKMSTGMKIDSDKWDKSTKRPKSPNLKYKGKNVTGELSRIENAFHEAMNFFDVNGGFSTMKLRERIEENLSGSSKSIRTGKSRFLEFYKEQTDEYKTLNINNWKGYNNTYKHLQSFFGRNLPDFEDIDMSFYVKYNKYLLEQNLSTNSISDHWKFIKAIMRKAQLLKFHTNTEYQLFKRTKEKADTVYLNEDELKKIFDLRLKGYLEKARDYFLVGCYSGLRYEDWDQVTKAKIKDGMMTIINKKTSDKSIFPVADNLQRILNKYPDGRLPTKPSNPNMNIYIKEVVMLAGITEPEEKRITKGGKLIIETKSKYERCTTHTARRSFATIMILNNVSHHQVMMMTGHTSFVSFEKYIRYSKIEAAIKLKESKAFKKLFGEALTWAEKMQHDPEFKKERSKLLL